jgi:membrane-bound lytic murein transglycosylase B
MTSNGPETVAVRLLSLDVMLFPEAFTQLDAGSFNLRIQLARFHRTFEQVQGGHQFRHSANLQGGFTLAEFNSAVTPGQASAARDWSLYRSRVVEPTHIEAGVRFWERNADTLARAERETGVSASTIVGILGVETMYGKHMGGYRTLDALSTLAFDFPAAHPKASQRAAYFLQELEEFLRLCKTQGLNPLEVRGSYAGALGMAQFMPSSWRQYAVDFDGDGRIDLFGSRADAIGSVANYLAAFHWKAGMALRGATGPAKARFAHPATKRHCSQPKPLSHAGARCGTRRSRAAPPRLAGPD